MRARNDTQYSDRLWGRLDKKSNFGHYHHCWRCSQRLQGLSLAAGYVLFLHPIWNSAQMQQCIGRVYRHGQEQQVKARVLAAQGSIENYVYKIQAQKGKRPSTGNSCRHRKYMLLLSVGTFPKTSSSFFEEY